MKIHARRKWNATGYVLQAGRVYRLRARGTWQDWFIPCGPDGFSRAHLRWFEWMRRQPKANWFALIGSIEKSKRDTFVIGSDLRLTAPATGQLYCYANDVPLAYCNNRGYVELDVEEVDDA